MARLPVPMAETSFSRYTRPVAPARCSGATELTPELHEAVKSGDVRRVRNSLASLQHLALINSKDYTGKTALMVAVEVDSVESLKLLLQRGAEVNEANKFSVTPLYVAVGSGRMQCAEELLNAGALVNTFTLTLHRTPLHLAAIVGNVEMAVLLLKYGANPNALDYGHRTPLHFACLRGACEVVRHLIKDGANVNMRDQDGMTPLGNSQCAECIRHLLGVEAALSVRSFRRMIREDPAVLTTILDLGVTRWSDSGVKSTDLAETPETSGLQDRADGRLMVTYKPFRDLSSGAAPFEAVFVQNVLETGRWELLRHPAMELLILLTKQDTIRIYVATLAFYLLFLACLLSTLLLDIFRPAARDAIRWLRVATIILDTCLCLRELVQFAFTGFRYWLRISNLLSAALVILTYVATISSLQEEAKRPFYAVIILLAFSELLLLMENIPKWKIYLAVSTLLQVTRAILRYLFIYLPILSGFSLAFFLLLGQDKDVFHNITIVVKMSAMVLGEVDVKDFEALTDGASPNSAMNVVSAIIAVLFMVLIPLVMLNLLLALTISDTRKVFNRGSVQSFKNVASAIAWNQLAVFSFDEKVNKLHKFLPRSVFRAVASFSLRLKWRSALARPSATERDTPVIQVASSSQDGRMIRVLVRGSGRSYSIPMRLKKELDYVWRKKAAAESSDKGPEGWGEPGGFVRDAMGNRCGVVRTESLPISLEEKRGELRAVKEQLRQLQVAVDRLTVYNRKLSDAI